MSKKKSKLFSIALSITITLLMFTSLYPYAYGIDLTTTEVISTESTSNSYYPSLAVGSDGTVHIAWYDHTDYDGSDTDLDIFYKKYVPGSGWTSTEVVSTESTSDSYEPSLGVGSDGTVHIAWYDYTDYGGSDTDRDIFYKKYVPLSGWTTTEVVSTTSTSASGYPSLAIGTDGQPRIAWQDETNYGGSDIDRDIFYRARSSPGWLALPTVISTESTEDSGYPSLGVGSDGTVHIAWHDGTDYGGSGSDDDIFYKKYVPGSGWTTTTVISTTSTSESSYPSLAIGTNGQPRIAWRDSTNYGGSDTDPDIFYRARSSIGWLLPPTVISTESTSGSYGPSLAVGSDGTVHIAWYDYTDYGGSDTDRDIFYKKYVPGSSWTTTEVVSTESTSSSYEPSLAVGSDGTVHIAWCDDTNYGGSGTDWDIFYKRLVGEYTREALWNRLVEIILAWPTSTPEQRAELWEEIVEIILLWPTAP